MPGGRWFTAIKEAFFIKLSWWLKTQINCFFLFSPSLPPTVPRIRRCLAARTACHTLNGLSSFCPPISVIAATVDWQNASNVAASVRYCFRYLITRLHGSCWQSLSKRCITSICTSGYTVTHYTALLYYDMHNVIVYVCRMQLVSPWSLTLRQANRVISEPQ